MGRGWGAGTQQTQTGIDLSITPHSTLTLAIAATFGPMVRANTVYPGMIETEMLAAWEGKDAFIAATGIERLGRPSDRGLRLGPAFR